MSRVVGSYWGRPWHSGAVPRAARQAAAAIRRSMFGTRSCARKEDEPRGWPGAMRLLSPAQTLKVRLLLAIVDRCGRG